MIQNILYDKFATFMLLIKPIYLEHFAKTPTQYLYCVEAFRVSQSGTCTTPKRRRRPHYTGIRVLTPGVSLEPGGSAEFIITERSTRRVDSDTDGKRIEFFCLGNQ